MVPWYLNPKNILLIALAVISVVASFMYVWQRNTVVKQKGEIKALTITNADLNAQIEDYKSAIVKIKKAQKEQQKIANDTASLKLEINRMKEKKCLEAQDEKIISDVTHFFNSHGVLMPGDSKTSGKVLPTTNPPATSGMQGQQRMDDKTTN